MAEANSQPSDHYRVLGVARRAEPDEIRKAYLDAARRWHPDRQAGKTADRMAEAERNMRQANEAFAVLSDPEQRRAYDQRWRQDSTSGRPGVRTDDGITRVDPRLLDPEFLAARRAAQIDEISHRSSVVVRAIPVVVVLALLGAIFVFTAYARDGEGPPVATTVPGPALGGDIVANDCVVITSGPALQEVPCTAAVAWRVIGARLPDGQCPLGTETEVELTNGAIVCLDPLT